MANLPAPSPVFILKYPPQQLAGEEVSQECYGGEKGDTEHMGGQATEQTGTGGAAFTDMDPHSSCSR